MFWIVFQIIKRCVRKTNKTTQKASYSFWFKAGCFRVGFLQIICVPCPQVGSSVAVLPVISLKIIKEGTRLVHTQSVSRILSSSFQAFNEFLGKAQV